MVIQRCGAILAILTCVTVASRGQQTATALEFEVASIKENIEPGSGGSLRRFPDGGLRAQHMPARSLLTIAYSLQAFEIIGAPEWTRTTYYDVNARPPGSTTREQMNGMLQGLLAERFKLRAHRERRTIDGFVLRRVRGDRLGPTLKPSTLDCQNNVSASRRCLQGGTTDGSFQSNGTRVAQMAFILEPMAGGPIEDQTGLEGTFDIDLRWSTDTAPQGDLPALPTALQEQLGLRLERRRVAREVLIVDRMERATPD